MHLVDEAAVKAAEVLKRCVHPRGFKAAAHYYPQVWARDGIIAMLGALTTDEAELIDAARATLATLAEFQCAETGRIAHFVPLDQPAIEVPINESFDSNLWYVIGHDLLFRKTGDRGFLARALPSIEEAIRWARFMDHNNDGLLECPPCCDWADTWDHNSHNLNVNVLYAAALASMIRIMQTLGGDASVYAARRERLIDMVQANFWIGHSEQREARYARCRPGHLENTHAINAAIQWTSDFFFPYLPLKEAAPRRLDTMGNLAAILVDVAARDQADRILNFIEERGVAQPFPVRVCYPVVTAGDPAYHRYYENRGYCMEHTGHNGGIWPFVGGFYVASLVKAGRIADAEQQLIRLAELNRLPAGRNDNPHWTPDWGFGEHHHGRTGRCIGAQWQAWSAGMYLYAVDAVRQLRCFGWEQALA